VLFRAINPLLTPLRSRFDLLLSARLMLLSHCGRRTGPRVHLPTGHFGRDDGVVSFSSARWWINLSDPQPQRSPFRARRRLIE
jgi:hypothetical protein